MSNPNIDRIYGNREQRNPLVCLQDYHDKAKEVLPVKVYSFYMDHADEGQTKQDSRAAFKRYRLRPRLMRDVSNREMSTTILGQRVDLPICISPTAYQIFTNDDGDKATARGGQSLNTIMIVSSWASFSYEDIASAAPNALLWCQIHLGNDRNVTRYHVKQAESAKFKAIVVACDSPVPPNRYLFKRGEMMTLREKHRIMPCYDEHNPEMQRAIANGDIALWEYTIKQTFNSGQTWEDIKWLKSVTHLPIVAKGVTTGCSAREAVEAGVDGILVSAHGGRMLDGIAAPIDALSEVTKAIKGSRVEVYMDGGVRQGTDVFKALALGARAVFLGRPILWGLAVGGANGVKNVLEIIRDELSLTMALTGCSKLDEIDESMVVHQSAYLSKL